MMQTDNAGNAESLSISLTRAKVEVGRLQRLINACEHTFTEGAQCVAACEIDLGESMGTTSVWEMTQRRTCSKCGLTQMRRQCRPDEAWGDWRRLPAEATQVPYPLIPHHMLDRSKGG